MILLRRIVSFGSTMSCHKPKQELKTKTNKSGKEKELIKLISAKLKTI
jgi:hypothetical protein